MPVTVVVYRPDGENEQLQLQPPASIEVQPNATVAFPAIAEAGVSYETVGEAGADLLVTLPDGQGEITLVGYQGLQGQDGEPSLQWADAVQIAEAPGVQIAQNQDRIHVDIDRPGTANDESRDLLPGASITAQPNDVFRFPEISSSAIQFLIGGENLTDLVIVMPGDWGTVTLVGFVALLDQPQNKAVIDWGFGGDTSSFAQVSAGLAPGGFLAPSPALGPTPAPEIEDPGSIAPANEITDFAFGTDFGLGPRNDFGFTPPDSGPPIEDDPPIIDEPPEPEPAPPPSVDTISFIHDETAGRQDGDPPSEPDRGENADPNGDDVNPPLPSPVLSALIEFGCIEDNGSTEEPDFVPRLFAVSGDGGDNETPSIIEFDLDGNASVAVSASEVAAALGVSTSDFNYDERGVAVDGDRNIFFSTTGTAAVLVKMANGQVMPITTAIDDPQAVVIGNDGTLFVLDDATDSIFEITDPLGAKVVTTLAPTSNFTDIAGIFNVDFDASMVISQNGNTIYVVSDGADVNGDDQNAIFAVDTTSGAVSLVVADTSTSAVGPKFDFDNLDDYMAIAPNGDLIVADDNVNILYRVDPSDGTVSVFLSNADIASVIGEAPDLEGGFAFDADGNFYLAEDGGDRLVMWEAENPADGTPDLSTGTVLASKSEIESDTGIPDVDFEGDMTFAEVPLPQGAVIGQAMTTFSYDGDSVVLDPVSNPSSGLTSDGQPINMQDFSSNVIVGRAGEGQLIFVVYLQDNGDGTADAWFVQCGQIDHDNPDDPDEAGPETNSFMDEIVQNLSFTVTGTGGSTSAPLIIEVQDDGPLAVIAAVGENMVVSDESFGTDGSQQDEPGDQAPDDEGVGDDILGIGGLIGYDESQLVTTAGSDVGNDTIGASTVVTLAFSSSATGLTTTDGTAVTLVQSSPTLVIGVAGEQEVFAIDIDGSGNVRLAQYESLTHGNTASHDEQVSLSGSDLVAVVTVTDGDEDVATDSIGIGDLVKFEDDGPLAQIAVNDETMVVTDESVGTDGSNADEPGDQAANDEVGGVDILGIGGLIGFDQAVLVNTSGSDVGEDDEGASTVVTLDFTSNATGLTTTDGTAVTLVQQSPTLVVGMAGAIQVFAIDIDGSGNVRVAQYESLFHGDTASHDDQVSLSGSDLSALVTVTDGDGDVDEASALIGGFLKFEDDGPVAEDDMDTADVGGPAIMGNVITGIGADGDPNGAGADDAGEDGAAFIRSIMHNGVTYTLNATNDGIEGLPLPGFDNFTDGVLTIDTAEGGVFSIVMVDTPTNADLGEYAYTPPAETDVDSESFIYGLEDGDGDVDLATLTINFDDMPEPQDLTLVTDETPGHLPFGAGAGEQPSGDAPGADEVSLADVDPALETAIEAALVADSVELDNALSIAQNIVSFDYGVNGPAATDPIVLVDPAGADSGLDDTATGQSILLTLESGFIVGRLSGSGEVAFVISLVDSAAAPSGPNNADSATVTFFQLRAIEHDDPADPDEDNPEDGVDEIVTVQYQLTDGDASDPEVKTGNISVSIEDDGPRLTGDTESNAVDEDDLDTNLSQGTDTDMQQDGPPVTATGSLAGLVDIGVDQPGGFSPVSLTNVDSGFDSKGEDVLLNSSGNTITGTAGARTVFTLVIMANGDYTFTLFDQLDHPDPGAATPGPGVEDVLSLDFSGFVQAVDEDGDSVILPATAFVIDVTDDIPNNINPDAARVANSATLGMATAFLDFADNIGADEDGTAFFSGGTNGDPAQGDLGAGLVPLTSNGNPIILSGFGTGTLTGFVNVGGDPNVFDDGDIKVFEIVLDPGADTYTVTVFDVIDNGGGEAFTDFDQVAAGSNEWAGVPGANVDILLTAGDPSTDSVNTSTQGLGVSNNLINTTDEPARVDFVTNLDLLGATVDFSDLSTIDFDSHATVNGGSVQVDGITGGTKLVDVKITAVNADDGGTFAQNEAGDYINDADDMVVPIDHLQIVILDALLDDGGVPVASAFRVEGDADPIVGLTVQLNNDGSITVFNLEQEMVVSEINSAGGFNRLEVENVDTTGNAFRITQLGFDEFALGDPIDIAADVTIEDEDGDQAGGTINITFLPTLEGDENNNELTGTDSDDFLAGGDGNDILDGGAGNDILFGQAGADSLTGGTGADEFRVGPGDGGATVALADVISDFMDAVDLIGLTDGLTFGELTIDQTQDVVGDATNDTVVSVTATSEILATLDGVDNGTTIDNNDFISA